MRILSIIFFTILFTNTAFTQGKEKKTPKHRTLLSFGLTASPDYYIYDFKIQDKYHLNYKSTFNYSYGVTAVYYPVKLLSFRIGVMYSTKGYTVDYDYTKSNPSFADSLKTETFNAAYLDLPLLMHLNLIHKDRVQLFLAAGIVPGLLLNNSAQYIKTNGLSAPDHSHDKDFNSLLAGTSYSLGFKYNISPRFGLGLEPYFRYYLTRIDNSSMGNNPISFGGKFAFYINLHHNHHKNTPWGSL